MTKTLDNVLKATVLIGALETAAIDMSALNEQNLEAQFFRIDYNSKGELTRIYWDKSKAPETKRYRAVYPIIDIERRGDYFIMHMGNPKIYQDR